MSSSMVSMSRKRKGAVKGSRAVRRRTGRMLSLPAILRSRLTYPEVKLVDTSYAGSFAGAGTFFLLNGVSVGSNFYNRVGRKISMSGLEIKGEIAASATNAAAEYLRYIIVYDRQANGAAPAVADVLEAYSNAGGVTSDNFSPKNPNNRDRFQIFRDKTIYVPAITVTAGVQTNVGMQDQSSCFDMKMYVKLGGLVAQYGGDGATVASISTGALYLLLVGSTGNYASAGTIRLRYYDS